MVFLLLILPIKASTKVSSLNSPTMTLLPRSTTRDRSVKFDSTPEPSSSEEDSALYSQHRQRKPKKAKAPTTNKVARAPGFCKHCRLPMLGHKKSNCMFLPRTDFFVNTAPPTADPPTVVSYESTKIEAPVVTNNANQNSAYSQHQPLDYMPQFSFSSSSFPSSSSSSSSSTPLFYSNPPPVNTASPPVYYPQAVPSNVAQTDIDDLRTAYYYHMNQPNGQLNMDLSDLSLLAANTTTAVQPNFMSFGVQQPEQYAYPYDASNTEELPFTTTAPFGFNFY